jgi:UDP-N-acetylmuramyl pentapeptide phosphotransferase/UDP-N-acetylglucosamine-1-phosphate transferase
MVLWPILFPALCAAMLMPLAIRARVLGHDGNFEGVQKVHEVPTSRLGGVIVVLAYVATLSWALPVDGAGLSLAVLLAIACVPVVLVGLSEDITGRIHPWQRLAASIASAAFASWLAGGVIARLDLPVIDGWLKHLVVVLPLTWFMVAGACNAMNLIDGAHGLAGGTALMMFAGLAAMAGYVGDSVVLAQALAMVGSIVGFLLWNYPRGKVFLGDAGAYFLGFMYAELSIQIVARNPGVSAWFVIALAAYPIVETLYSIYRRKLVHRTSSMQPDAEHLHSLIFRSLAARRERGDTDGTLNSPNARVAPYLWLHGAICLVVALVFYDNTVVLMAFSALYALCYVACYKAQMQKGAWRFPAVFRTHRAHEKGSSRE